MNYFKRRFKTPLAVILVILICITQYTSIFALNPPVASENISGHLTIMTSGQNIQPYKEKFNQLYPNIELEILQLSDYEKEIGPYLQSGNYGDILLIPNFISSSDYERYFEPLGKLSVLETKYNFMTAKSYNGNVYGFPLSVNIQGMLYNKKVFAEAGISKLPKTPDEFLYALSLIKDNTSAIPFYTNSQTDGWGLTIWENYTYGAMTGDPSYRYNTFTQEANPFAPGKNHYIVYKLLYDIIAEGYAEPADSTIDWKRSKNMINEGKIGCMAIGSWAVSQCKAAGAFPENLGYMPFPYTVNGKQYATAQEDYSFGISKNSKNKAAARAWIDFMIEDSTYALDNSSITIQKNATVPSTLDNFKNVEFIIDIPSTEQNSGILARLHKAVPVYDVDVPRRIYEAARGESGETFDEIMDDWNFKWEKIRPNKVDTSEESIPANQIVTQTTPTLSLSPRENVYLESVPTLKVGYLKNLPPLQYEKDDEFVGISSSIFDAVTERTSLKFEYIGFDTYDDLVAALETGTINIIAGIDQNCPYENVTYSKDYLNFVNVLLKNQSLESTDISGLNVASTTGFPTNYSLDNCKFLYCKNTEECLDAVNKHKVDVSITNYYTANHYIKLGNYTNITIQPIMGESLYSVGFSKNEDPRLVSIFNKVIYSISNEEMQSIIFKHTEIPLNTFGLFQILNLHPVATFVGVLIFFTVLILVVYYVMSMQVDYSKRIAIDAKKYMMVSDFSNEYLFEYNYAKDTIWFSEKFIKIVNLSKSDFTLEELKGLDADGTLEKVILKFLETQIPKQEFTLSFNSSDPKWYRATASVLQDNGDKPIYLLGKIVNIEEEIAQRQQLEGEAIKDPLTGLYNRTGLNNLYPEINEKRKDNTYSALYVLDFDYFKTVNDSLGHSGGDELLKLLANTLTDIFHENAVVSRIGGDEFVVYQTDIYTREELATKAEEICRRMCMNYLYQNSSCNVSVSVGYVITQDDVPYQELFDKADATLYAVKKDGRNGCKEYSSHIA